MKKCVLASTLAASLVISTSAFSAALSGTYVGHYSLTMNAHRDNGINNMPWPESTLDGLYQGNKYKILGNSITDGIWVWDFDQQTVTISGSTLLAMGMLYVPFQAFNAAEIENRRADQTVVIDDLAEITFPFEYDSVAGLYKIEYAQKKYVQPPFPVEGVANYPIGLTQSYLRIQQQENGTLTISTADVEEGIEPDQVPGTRIEGVFPAIVQVEYQAKNMLLDNKTDSNNDGISDALAKLLQLDPLSGDTDGDHLDDIVETPVYLRGKDSDADGISDALEAGDWANDATRASGIVLNNGHKLTLSSSNDIPLSYTYVSEVDLTIANMHTLTGELPPSENSDKQTLDYGYGMLNFNLGTQEKMLSSDSVSVNIKMANPPQGLEIYHIVKKFDMDAGGFVQAFVKLAWSENADQSIDLTLQNPNLYPILSSSLIFTAPQVKSEGDKPDTAASSSSGGSMGLWSLWLLGLASLRRPLTSWKRQSR
ncbi:TPA: hypothetical protein I7747_05830 [Vibrio vulnificus]|uniref:hypothetical protein n=1 Tax=Vibrio vulnificus TaxID=672 RepID=UPI001302CB89|nr:hypothetical protein [Vibrio vulnificus]MCU8205232.1 hypothetical protein [Vibrio vulnificus]HAS8422119.1 hypothetical protein [Vibrio vulnificus]